MPWAGSRPGVNTMRNTKETQCNIRGGFPIRRHELFHYITICLLGVVIAINFRPVEAAELCNDQCQLRLEGYIQMLLSPTLDAAKSAIENLDIKVKSFEIDTSKALQKFDKTTDEVNLIKDNFDQTHIEFKYATKKTEQTFRETTLHLQEQTETTLEHFRTKAMETVSLLESIKTTTDNHFSGILRKATESAEKFTKAQEGSVERIESATTAITTKAEEVSDEVERSMNKIKDTAQKSYDKFGQAQTELLDKTEKDVLKFAKTLETKSNVIGQKLSDLVIEVTKTTSDNVKALQDKQDVLFNEINGNLKGFTSSVEEMKKSTEEKLSQTMILLQTTTQTTVDSIQNKTDTSLAQFLKAQEESVGKVERSTSQVTDTLVRTSEKVVKTLEESKESTEKTITGSITSLQDTTTKTMLDITSKVDTSIANFQKSQDDSLSKIETLATKAVDNIEESSNGVFDSLRKSSTSTQEKIDNSIATFQKRTDETVNHLRDKTDSTIDKLEKAQTDSFKRIETGAETAVRTIEHKGIAIFKDLDDTKTIWRTSVNSIATNAEDDKEITKLKRVALGEFNDQTRNLKTSVEEINKHEREIVTRTTDTTDVLKATAVTLRDKLFETSVNFYITWCILAAVLVFSRTQQGTGGNKPGAATPPVNNNTGNNRQDTKHVQPVATSKDRQLNIPTGPPKYDITVVTFSTECLTKAPELFSKPMSGKTVQYRVLTGTLNLFDVPPSMGYVVLIGTDARNTILEDMDGSAGSRKRETITALQKTQGDVLVVYLDNNYHDVEDPPEGVLVNPHLHRTSSHPILRDLVTRQRLITLRREAWSAAQTEHLTGWARRLR